MADAWTHPVERSAQSYAYLSMVGGLAAPLFLWLAGLTSALGGEAVFMRTHMQPGATPGVVAVVPAAGWRARGLHAVTVGRIPLCLCASGGVIAAALRANRLWWLRGGFLLVGRALVLLGLWISERPAINRQSSFLTSSLTFFAVRSGIFLTAVGNIDMPGTSGRLRTRPAPLAVGRHSLLTEAAERVQALWHHAVQDRTESAEHCLRLMPTSPSSPAPH